MIGDCRICQRKVMVTVAQMNLIRNKISAPDGPGLFPQNHIRILPVDVHGNAGHAIQFT